MRSSSFIFDCGAFPSGTENQSDFKANLISIRMLGGHELVLPKFPGMGEDTLTRLGRPAFLAMRKTQDSTFSGLRNWYALSNTFHEGLLRHFLGVF